MDKKNIRIVAEAVGLNEQLAGYQPNDVFMAVKFRAMSTKENLNGDVIERSFMDDVCENSALYLGTPVKVDVASLLASKKLGHRFNEQTGEWETDQVGSIQSFEIEEGDDEDILYCTARIEKGRSDVCAAISDLYDAGGLAFSFEIIASDLRTEGGVTYIGASENNYLTAMCIVTNPAYKDGKAVALAAEMENDMEDKENMSEQLEAETQTEHRDAITVDAAQTETNPVDAAVIVREEMYQRDETTAYDTETGVEVSEVVSHEVAVRHVEENAILVQETAPVEAEIEQDEQPETEEEDEEKPEEGACGKHKNADEMDALQAELDELRAFKARIEAEEQERANAVKREKLKLFAERAGADVEALTQEIHDLNYEAVIMAELAEDKPEQKIQAETNDDNVVVMLENVSLTKGKWDGYISDASGMNE